MKNKGDEKRSSEKLNKRLLERSKKRNANRKDNKF